MKLITPQHRWPIWLLAAGVPISFVATGFLHYPLLLWSGLLDPKADSIAIPMFQDMELAAFSVPFIGFLTLVCLHEYRGGAELLSWGHKPTFRFWFTTIIAGMLIALVLYDTITGMFSVFWWCNLLWIPNTVMLVLWVLVLRATVLSRAS